MENTGRNNKGQFIKGCSFSPLTQFKKGQISLRKGIKLNYTVWNKGKHLKFFSEENNPSWKGDGVGYFALHDWVEKKLGKAFWCTWCFSMQKVQWANISRKYKRDINDWMQLCVKCHGKFDSGLDRGSIAKVFTKSNGHGERITHASY